MAEESKILQKLVKRQVEFQEAMKQEGAKTRKVKPVQLPLPGIESIPPEALKTHTNDGKG